MCRNVLFVVEHVFHLVHFVPCHVPGVSPVCAHGLDIIDVHALFLIDAFESVVSSDVSSGWSCCMPLVTLALLCVAMY